MEKKFCNHYLFLERMYIDKGGEHLLDLMQKHHPDIAGTPCRACVDEGRLPRVDSTK